MKCGKKLLLKATIMSRIGKKPIIIPTGVEVTMEDGSVLVKGPKGELKKDFLSEIKIELIEAEGQKAIEVSILRNGKKSPALWGLTRALLANMVEGVTSGYQKKLQIEGIGFKAAVEGDGLTLNLGFSHPIKIKKEAGVEFLVEKNILIVSGIDKQQVGQVAAKIRKIKPPEPYKGKGIRYVGEYVRRKAGKKAVATSK